MQPSADFLIMNAASRPDKPAKLAEIPEAWCEHLDNTWGDTAAVFNSWLGKYANSPAGIRLPLWMA
jgi:hypothetical protein